MNILLWIVQALLAFFCLSGGGWKIVNTAKLPPTAKVLPAGAWKTLGALELLCALGLILPGAFKIFPVVTPVAALILALEAILLAGLYGRFNRKLSSANPMTYALIQLALAAIVAYGRFVLA